MKCSRRSSVNFTGRSSCLAAHGTSTSSGHGCMIFTPKPPPTSGVITSTSVSARSSLAATAARTPVEVWVEVHRRRSAGLRIPAGQHAAAFHRGRRGPLDVQVELQHARGGGDDRGGVAVLLHRVRRDVAGHVGMHEVLGFPGRVDTDHGGQFLITDVDQVGGVFGQVAIGGDDHDDGLADVVDLILRQRVRRPAVG